MSNKERKMRFIINACNMGFTFQEIRAIKRDAQRLTTWNVNECNGWIERDDNGKCFRVCGQSGPGPIKRYPTRDMETPAKKRITSLVESKGLKVYFQSDPRGESVYILRGDQQEDKYYDGLAVPTVG